MCECDSLLVSRMVTVVRGGLRVTREDRVSSRETRNSSTGSTTSSMTNEMSTHIRASEDEKIS